MTKNFLIKNDSVLPLRLYLAYDIVDTKFITAWYHHLFQFLLVDLARCTRLGGRKSTSSLTGYWHKLMPRVVALGAEWHRNQSILPHRCRICRGQLSLRRRRWRARHGKSLELMTSRPWHSRTWLFFLVLIFYCTGVSLLFQYRMAVQNVTEAL